MALLLLRYIFPSFPYPSHLKGRCLFCLGDNRPLLGWLTSQKPFFSVFDVSERVRLLLMVSRLSFPFFPWDEDRLYGIRFL